MTSLTAVSSGTSFISIAVTLIDLGGGQRDHPTLSHDYLIDVVVVQILAVLVIHGAVLKVSAPD